MCLIENKVVPKGNIFYKVFYERADGLYWLVRNDKADTSLGKDKLPKIIPDSTEYGFCVWETEDSANQFMDWFSNCYLARHFKRGKFVVCKVKCSNHIRSGMAKLISTLSDNDLRAQAFAFKNIKVI